jgi:hypothetical protein
MEKKIHLFLQDGMSSFVFVSTRKKGGQASTVKVILRIDTIVKLLEVLNMIISIARHNPHSLDKKDIQGRRYIGITLFECLGPTVARTLAYSRGLIFTTIIFLCQ